MKNKYNNQNKNPVTMYNMQIELIKKYGLTEDHVFSYENLMQLLDQSIGKSLGEVDKNKVFDKTISNPKITGIAGDVVEQSILGYKPDSEQRPDILIDTEPYEVKTTGIKHSKEKDKKHEYEAKEPMSITAVSVNTITKENFESSHFWMKLKNMLIIYYLYDADETVPAKDYARFPLKGYELHHFDENDIEILKNDWNIVHDFIKDLQDKYDNPENEYHRISSELRDKLMYIDTAPKWPNSPRFRLKRSFVSSFVQSYFSDKLEDLPEKYTSYSSLDEKLHKLTEQYKGKTVKELVSIFKIPIKNENKLTKNVCEPIIVKMLGGNSGKLNDISIFQNAGIIAKTVCLSSKEKRTEDTKFSPIDFGEIKNKSLSFEDSQTYDDFMNHQILCIIFQEKDEKQEFKDNKFLGFKRLQVSNEFIQKDVQNTWNTIRYLVNENKLVETPLTKSNGELRVNKTGVISTFINFPKSQDNIVFVRGSGSDSTAKPLLINGIKMYKQYLWIKGSYIVGLLKKIDYL